MEEKSLEKEIEENKTILKDDVSGEFEPETLIEAVREVNNEVLQMEEIRSQTDKLKWDLISYLKRLLEEYNLTLTIPAKSLSGIKGLTAMHFNKTGIITYHFRDGSINSFELRTLPSSQLLNILNAVMPHLKSVLKVKRKEYEEVSSLLSKLGKHILILKEEPTDWAKQHPL